MLKQSKKTSDMRLFALLDTFSELFEQQYRTVLVSGGSEPVYLSANASNEFHRIIFSHDYLSSALHECAHWCVAGEMRRRIDDYGYWYAPDGRSDQQQQLFEQVEVKPQSLERIFSVACGHRFRISADNVLMNNTSSEEFVHAIQAQTLTYCRDGLPTRAALLTKTLAKKFNIQNPLSDSHYRIEELR